MKRLFKPPEKNSPAPRKLQNEGSESSKGRNNMLLLSSWGSGSRLLVVANGLRDIAGV